MSNKQKLLGNLTYGLTFIVSAPAGTGKTTLVQMLTKEFDSVKMSISSTTRPRRPYEVNGVDYNFLTDAEFDKKIKEGDFLEHVELFGYRYGTSSEQVEMLKKKGYHVVLVIDTQGALLLKEKIKATFIFLMPPSQNELVRRLRDRGTEEEGAIRRRIEWSEKEMEQMKLYDYQIINDDLSCAYQVLRSILIAEEHRV